MPLGVHSEVGRLRRVMVHRPGLEHSRLTPSNAEDLLFDDVIWVARAKAEHDMFVEAMRSRGVEVFLAEKLLAEALAKPEADKLATERGWTFKRDGDRMRRVVPSPVPKRIFEHRPIKWLLDQGCVVICAGGGGIPVAYRPGRQLIGIEAVIDKDRASALLARDVGADILIMASDASAVFVGFGTPGQRAIAQADPDALLTEYRAEFAAGSMLPKGIAACDFAQATGKPAAIGALSDIDAMLAGTAGTRVVTGVTGVEFAPS